MRLRRPYKRSRRASGTAISPSRTISRSSDVRSRNGDRNSRVRSKTVAANELQPAFPVEDYEEPMPVLLHLVEPSGARGWAVRRCYFGEMKSEWKAGAVG